MDWSIIRTELSYRTSRSSGPGGQHVNKTETKVEVLFDVRQSVGLSDEEKAIILDKLATRINNDGLIAVRSQKSKSQLENKAFVTHKLELLLANALIPRKKRVPTKRSKSSVEDRLAAKKRISEKKEIRRKPKA